LLEEEVVEMAETIVEVCKIELVTPHPNADALELTQIKGWQCVVPLGKYQAGDLVTYIPIDSLIPLEHADRWGITKYLSVRTGPDAPTPPAGRVRCARLRGEPSFGVIIDREDPSWAEGQDVKAHYGITKYIPPLRTTAGDAERPHPLFVEYTDIENLRNFTDVLEPGEEVILTEKIHGTNSRVGMIEGELMAGSMSLRRKRPETDREMAGNTYWYPLTLPAVRALVEEVGAAHRQVILYGEVYGSGIQDLHYGCRGALGFRAFDLLVDGKFLDADPLLALCVQHGVETVPLLYRGPYTLETVREHAAGDTTLAANHIREGVVVKPVVERTHPKVGRVALKYIGDQYLFSKSADRDTNDV
jgi:RNA ligase (TIGR02306 family)